MKKYKLDACPFCGASVAEIATAHNLEECANFEDFDVCPVYCPSGDCGLFVVVCSMNAGGCGASSGYRTSPAKAAAAWNERAKRKEVNGP